MSKCPSCAAPIAPQLVCLQCGAPLPLDLDCFAALGILRNLTIDPDELETAYHNLSRKVHPDRFAAKSATLRDSSLRATALLTRSYRTLRDPVARGLYWLELNGDKLSENNNHVPPDLAALVFAVQEQLEELRAGGSPSSRGEVQARLRGLQTAFDEAHARLADNFSNWDGGNGDRKKLTNELKSILARVAYLRTLIRDVERALEESTATESQAKR